MEPKISAPTRLEEILAEWDMDQNMTQSTLYSPSQDTITLSSVTDTIDLSSLTVSSITSPYTVTGAVGTSNMWNTGTTTAPWMTQNPTSAKIQLDGEDSDITVNGWSLVDAVKRIEERLGLYQPNPELEREWEELRDLGEQYRQLEQHIKDKQATFDRLRAMPPPEEL